MSEESTAWGPSIGAVNPHLCICIPPRCQVRERGEERIKPSHSLNIGVFNMRGGIANEVEKCEIGKMFLKRRLDLCAISETKLKRKGEVLFGVVVGRGSAVQRPREGEECFPVTERLVAEVCSGMERGVIQAYVG